MVALDPAVWQRLETELLHVEREVMSLIAHTPETKEYSGRLRWYNDYAKELDRVIGVAGGGKDVGLAVRLAGHVPIKWAYTDGAEMAGHELHVAMPMIPVRAIEFLERGGLVHMEGLADDLRDKLKTEVISGLIRGEGTDLIARRLRAARVPRGKGVPRGRLEAIGVFGTARERAKVIAEDQVARAFLRGRDLLYGDEEVSDVQITGQEMACPVCAPWIGHVVSLDYAHANYPRHPRCKCDYIAAIRKGVELVDGAEGLRKAE